MRLHETTPVAMAKPEVEYLGHGAVGLAHTVDTIHGFWWERGSRGGPSAPGPHHQGAGVSPIPYLETCRVCKPGGLGSRLTHLADTLLGTVGSPSPGSPAECGDWGLGFRVSTPWRILAPPVLGPLCNLMTSSAADSAWHLHEKARGGAGRWASSEHDLFTYPFERWSDRK